jgi:hypothetical protein
MKGITYFRLLRWGCSFSINEGEFPNIHLTAHLWGLFFYICLGKRVRWNFTLGTPWSVA